MRKLKPNKAQKYNAKTIIMITLSEILLYFNILSFHKMYGEGINEM